MTQRNRSRRAYLVETGAIASGIALAGCLGGDETDSPTENPESTEPGTSEPTETTTGDNSTTENQGATEDGDQTGVEPSDMMQSIPAGNAMSFGDGVSGIGRGYPSAVIQTLADSAAEHYREEGYFVPDWSDAEIGDLEEKGFIEVDDFGSIEFYRFSDSESVDPEGFERVSEYEGREIMSDGDSYMVELGDNRYAIRQPVGLDKGEEEIVEALQQLVDGSESNMPNFLQSEPAGEVLANYEEGHLHTAYPEDMNPLSGEKFSFSSDSYMIQRLEGDNPSSMEVQSTNEFSSEEYPGTPF